MPDYIDRKYLGLFKRYYLHSFDALWSLELGEVDTPNTSRGGWSIVSRLQLTNENGIDIAFFVKRQLNYLCRPWRHPLGEPTFSREFRNIKNYETLGLPTVEATYFAERMSREGPMAILITRELEHYQPLNQLFAVWRDLAPEDQRRILSRVGSLIGKLHGHGLIHGHLHPKHIFVSVEQQIPVRLIDLEMSRRRWWHKRNSLAEMSKFLRSAAPWSLEEKHAVIRHYLQENPTVSSVDRLTEAFRT